MPSSIVLGSGCFWCTEAIFGRVRGVKQVISGYAGGKMKNPTYHNHGNHAEVIKVVFNEKVISLAEILSIFFQIHDPTTANRQGHDIGTQYRSIILFTSVDDQTIANDQLKLAQKAWDKPIVTEIQKLDTFYKAEDYHQNYYKENKANPYCQAVIIPKLAKFQIKFSDYLK